MSYYKQVRSSLWTNQDVLFSLYSADSLFFCASYVLELILRSLIFGMLAYVWFFTLSKWQKVDYERRGKNWQKKIQSTTSDWEQNFGTILGYSPFREENDILEQVTYFSIFFCYYCYWFQLSRDIDFLWSSDVKQYQCNSSRH